MLCPLQSLPSYLLRLNENRSVPSLKGGANDDGRMHEIHGFVQPSHSPDLLHYGRKRVDGSRTGNQVLEPKICWAIGESGASCPLSAPISSIPPHPTSPSQLPLRTLGTLSVHAEKDAAFPSYRTALRRHGCIDLLNTISTFYFPAVVTQSSYTLIGR